MLSLSYDLHIHSCLSPCADDDMTPANIAGMVMLKGLEVAALTDHNSARNCPAFLKEAARFGFLGIPGVEVTTMEEVHALCYFSNLEAAMDFDSYLYGKLMLFPNDPAVFGNQIIYNEKDEPAGTEEMLLINAAEIPFEELAETVGRYDGVMVPAHIEKEANGLLPVMGFLPPEPGFRTAEIKDMKALHGIKEREPYFCECRILCSSDAHELQDIHEPGLTLPVEERTPEAVIEALKTGLGKAEG